MIKVSLFAMFCSIETCFSLDDYVQVLEKEVNIDFCRSMNQIIFDQTVNSDARTYAFVTLPPSTALPPPNFGMYPTPTHPYIRFCLAGV